MEKLLQLLTREFRDFKTEIIDRISKLEGHARIVPPPSVPVADEPETPTTDAGAAETAGATGSTGATADAGATGAADPAADAKAKTAKSA